MDSNQVMKGALRIVAVDGLVSAPEAFLGSVFSFTAVTEHAIAQVEYRRLVGLNQVVNASSSWCSARVIQSASILVHDALILDRSSNIAKCFQ